MEPLLAFLNVKLDDALAVNIGTQSSEPNITIWDYGKRRLLAQFGLLQSNSIFLNRDEIFLKEGSHGHFVFLFAQTKKILNLVR